MARRNGSLICVLSHREDISTMDPPHRTSPARARLVLLTYCIVGPPVGLLTFLLAMAGLDLATGESNGRHVWADVPAQFLSLVPLGYGFGVPSALSTAVASNLLRPWFETRRARLLSSAILGIMMNELVLGSLVFLVVRGHPTLSGRLALLGVVAVLGALPGLVCAAIVEVWCGRMDGEADPAHALARSE